MKIARCHRIFIPQLQVDLRKYAQQQFLTTDKGQLLGEIGSSHRGKANGIANGRFPTYEEKKKHSQKIALFEKAMVKTI